MKLETALNPAQRADNLVHFIHKNYGSCNSYLALGPELHKQQSNL